MWENTTKGRVQRWMCVPTLTSVSTLVSSKITWAWLENRQSVSMRAFCSVSEAGMVDTWWRISLFRLRWRSPRGSSLGKRRAAVSAYKGVCNSYTYTCVCMCVCVCTHIRIHVCMFAGAEERFFKWSFSNNCDMVRPVQMVPWGFGLSPGQPDHVLWFVVCRAVYKRPLRYFYKTY